MPYSAGTVLLQVEISYDGVQDANRRMAKGLAKSLEESIEQGSEAGAKKGAEKISKILGEGTSKGAGEAGEEAAEKYAGAFRDRLKKTIATMQREIKPIKLTADTENLADDLERARDILKELSKRNTVKVGADTTEIRDKMFEAAEIISRVNKAATIEIKGDTDPAIKAAKSFEKYIDGLNPEIKVELETTAAERQLGAFEKKLKTRLTNAMSAIGDSGSRELQQLQARLQALNLKKIGIDVSGEQAQREITQIERDLAHLTATTTSVQIHGDASDALKALESAERARERLDGKRARVKVDVDGAGKAAAQLTLLDRIMDKLKLDGRDTANSFRFFNFTALAVSATGAALIPILAALTGGMLGLGTATLALIPVVGVLLAGFSGIGTAVGALNDAQDEAAKTAQQSAVKMRNAAEAVEDAERALARAREDASQRAQDAERAVVDAKESAARSIERALERQAAAERNLTRSNQDALQAQKDLIEARRQAQKDLDDIAARQKRNALDERQGVIDLFNATVENQAVLNDGSATNLEKEQAAINLGNAKLRLEEIRKAEKDLAEQRKQGVNGTQRVKTAQDAVTAAVEAQRDAVRELKEADKDLVEARLDGSRRVQDALRDQRRVVEDNAESIEDATRNLQRSQQDYQDALKETGEIGSASAQKVKDAMAGLSPAGQAFALFLHGLRDEWFALRAAIQEGLLPGVQQALTILIDEYGPEFTRFVGGMAKVLGDLFVYAARLFTSDAWKGIFGTIERIAPIITEDFGKAFLNWLTAFGLLAQASAPFALLMSQAMVDLSEAVLTWVQSKQGQKAIQDFFAYIREIGPDVKAFLKALALALLAIVQALAQFGDDILRALTAVLTWIADMDPDKLAAIVGGILALVAAFQALSGLIALISVVVSPVGLIVVAVLALVAALVYLYQTNEHARRVIQEVWEAIVPILQYAFEVWKFQMDVQARALVWLGEKASELWHNYLEPFFSWLGPALKNLWVDTVLPILTAFAELFVALGQDIHYVWTEVIWPVLSAIGEVVWQMWWLFARPAFDALKLGWDVLWASIKFVFDRVIRPIFSNIAKLLGFDDAMKENGGGLVGAFRAAIALIKTIWDGLGEIAKAPVRFMVDTVINGALIGGFNQLAKHLPGLTEVAPVVLPPGFSSGGIADSTYGIRPGYMPGRDNQIIAVGGGEAILRPEASAVLGPNWVNAINRRAKHKGQQGVAEFLGGYKDGIQNLGGGTRTNNSFGDYDRAQFRGHRLNYRTIRMLLAAEKLAGQTIQITQGSYSNSVAASGSTHSGGGAFDLGWPGMGLGQVLVAALRLVGTASWHRSPSQGPWNHHIHGIAIGDPTASPAAKRQVQDYYNGGDGLGGRDDGPAVEKDPSLLDKIGGKVGGLLGWVADAVSNPIDWLKGKISDKLGEFTKEFGDNSFTKIIKAIPEKIIGGMADMISGGLDFIGIGGGDASGIKGMVQGLAKSMFGWEGGQWSALERLVQKESSWNPNAQNPTSTAYGLFQFLNGTWGAYGEKTSDPRLQAQYGMQYIKDRYGSPEQALAFHESHNWYSDGGTVPDNGTMMYDNGGYLAPGVTRVVNLTGKPEPVFTSEQFEGMNRGSGGAKVHYEPHFLASDLTADDVAQDLVFTLTRLDDGVLK